MNPMKSPSFTQVFFTAIISGAAITITAIALNFTGVLDISCGSEGCRLRLESEAKSLPTAKDVSDSVL